MLLVQNTSWHRNLLMPLAWTSINLCLVHLDSGETLNRLLFILGKMNEELSAENKSNENKLAEKHVRSTIIVLTFHTIPTAGSVKAS
jgi:hypothetical protein